MYIEYFVKYVLSDYHGGVNVGRHTMLNFLFSSTTTLLDSSIKGFIAALASMKKSSALCGIPLNIEVQTIGNESRLHTEHGHTMEKERHLDLCICYARG